MNVNRRPHMAADVDVQVSVQLVQTTREGELSRLDEPCIGDADTMQLALEIALSEVEELRETREARREIEVLPDE